jgi:hypothetical protein
MEAAGADQLRMAHDLEPLELHVLVGGDASLFPGNGDLLLHGVHAVQVGQSRRGGVRGRR